MASFFSPAFALFFPIEPAIAINPAPRTRTLAFAPSWLLLGGAINGFFGGLAGMQGTLRSAFLRR